MIAWIFLLAPAQALSTAIKSKSENSSIWLLSQDPPTAKPITFSFFENISFDEIQNQNFKNSFQQLIMKKKVQDRIVNQFSNYQIALLGSVFSSAASNTNHEKLAANKILKIIENQSHHFKASFWKMIFEVWNNQQKTAPISYYYENKTFFSAKKISFELYPAP